MKPTHILWDFNGTLLDDVSACISSINELLQRYGLDKIPSVEYYQSVFGFPVIEYYKRVGFDFSKYKFEDLAIEWVELYNKYSKPLLCPKVVEALEYVKKSNVPQIILTASDVNMVKDQLSQLNITYYFSDIIGMDNIHAYGKTGIAKKWAERVKPARAVLIGDTVHDAETAKLSGFEFIPVCCGHQSKETLSDKGQVFDNVYDAVKSVL